MARKPPGAPCSRCGVLWSADTFHRGQYACIECAKSKRSSLGFRCSLSGCSTPVGNKSYLCTSHRWAFRAYPRRHVDGHGYVLLVDRTHPNSRPNGVVAEHHVVMSSHLGRRIYTELGENVHHKNGLRHDNRLENLELWTSMQPSGQRVEDLVAFAHQILSIYGGTQ